MTTENYTGASLAINQYGLNYKDLASKERARGKFEHMKLYRTIEDSALVLQYDARDDHFEVYHWRYE